MMGTSMVGGGHLREGLLHRGEDFQDELDCTRGEGGIFQPAGEVSDGFGEQVVGGLG